MTIERPVRIPPLPESEWSDEAREIMAPFMADGRPFNIFRTLTRHPKLFRRWLVFANHVLGKSTLPPREREIAILRIGHLCRAPYEWGQHVLIARREAGMTDAEISAIRTGPDAPIWTEAERALLQATDELKADSCVSDATFEALQQHFSEQQIMDIVFAVGQYNLVSMALNTLGVPLDDFLPEWDEH